MMISLWSILSGKIAVGILWLLVPVCVFFAVNSWTLSKRLDYCNENNEALIQRIEEIKNIPRQSIDELQLMERQRDNTEEYYKNMPKKTPDDDNPISDDQLDTIFGLFKKDRSNKDISTDGESGDSK
jgi:hypothetical protein